MNLLDCINFACFAMSRVSRHFLTKSTTAYVCEWLFNFHQVMCRLHRI